jgi:hypothetical protein
MYVPIILPLIGSLSIRRYGSKGKSGSHTSHNEREEKSATDDTAIAMFNVKDVRPILKAYQGKDIPVEYAKKEAEAKRVAIEEWERRNPNAGQGGGAGWLGGMFGGVAVSYIPSSSAIGRSVSVQGRGTAGLKSRTNMGDMPCPVLASICVLLMYTDATAGKRWLTG